MGIKHKIKALCFQLEKMHSEQGPPLQLERLFKLSLDPVFGGLMRVVLPLQVQRCHGHRHARGKALQRHALLVTLIEQDHAQRIVLLDQQAHGLHEQIGVEGAIDLHIAADVV